MTFHTFKCETTHSSAFCDRPLPFTTQSLSFLIDLVLSLILSRPATDAGFQDNARRVLALKPCHVASADGGEAWLFDRGGAARSAPCVICYAAQMNNRHLAADV